MSWLFALTQGGVFQLWSLSHRYGPAVISVDVTEEKLGGEDSIVGCI